MQAVPPHSLETDPLLNDLQQFQGSVLALEVDMTSSMAVQVQEGH